ncbi:MAG: adenosylcobinamide-GDP ribazoletransferase [Synergistaceae bacterium]|nr:adenosylcobinamide-GDP ribazoletransferase [Synergistaceae bacterium]
MTDSFIIAVTFISIIPIPSRLIPKWDSKTLRYFPLMLPVAGIIFGLFWVIYLEILSALKLSSILRGFIMTVLTLTLTGGLHLDGLMDTSDAIFSHRDRETKLKILSDTHAGSFAVMSCVILIMAKTLLFSELFTLNADYFALSSIPLFSRLGMGILLTNLPFAKNDGLAVMMGAARKHSDNFGFAVIFLLMSLMNLNAVPIAFILSLIVHVIICRRIFGGITGDLLGAFVETSEVIMLTGTVIETCI